MTLIILLVSSNGVWIYKQIKNSNRNAYDSTENCEKTEFIYMLSNFPRGTTWEEFQIKADKQGLIYEVWDHNAIKSVSLKDVLQPCPKSSRPYCGIALEFKNLALDTCYALYPCH